jgi:ribosomal protein S18 acetylase RimI-like enzyme
LKNLHGFLKIEPVSRFQHPLFNLLEFRFFAASERGKALVFGNPPLLMLLFIIPYVLVGEIAHFRGKRFFVRLGKRIVGVFVLNTRHKAIVIGSLAVSPLCRGFGVGWFMLGWIEGMCRRMNKEWLELSVLRGNVPAQHLYYGFGFRKAVERRWSFVLRKRVGN